MLTLTIEPGVFSPPSGPPTAESLRNYVSTLLHWKSIMDSGSATILTSRATNNILIQCNCYPFRPWLRALLAKASVIEYDFNTVAVLAESLIGQSDSLEEMTGIEDILVAEVQIEPDVFAGHASSQLKSESERCAVVVAIFGTISKDPSAPGHGIAMRSGIDTDRISVSAKIEIIDHHRMDLGTLPMTPNRFKGGSVVCQSFENFIGALNVLALWKVARMNTDLETTARIAIFQSRLERRIPTSWSSIPQFRINDRFYDSVRACGGLAADSLARSTLRSIVDTVEDLRLAATHPLRTGAGPNDPQKKRGNDLAWRRNVTYEHHLHYWQPTTGQPKELSCLVAHNCLDIFS